jgi:hypothetical protein
MRRSKRCTADAPETPTPIELDDHRRAKVELTAMARSLVEGSGHLVESLFLNEVATPYEPCIMTRDWRRTSLDPLAFADKVKPLRLSRMDRSVLSGPVLHSG